MSDTVKFSKDEVRRSLAVLNSEIRHASEDVKVYLTGDLEYDRDAIRWVQCNNTATHYSVVPMLAENRVVDMGRGHLYFNGRAFQPVMLALE